MGKFLKENWIWIVAPIVLVLIFFVAIIMSQGSDETSPFVYNIF